jgi:hypothetical protein
VRDFSGLSLFLLSSSFSYFWPGWIGAACASVGAVVIGSHDATNRRLLFVGSLVAAVIAEIYLVQWADHTSGRVLAQDMAARVAGAAVAITLAFLLPQALRRRVASRVLLILLTLLVSGLLLTIAAALVIWIYVSNSFSVL